MNSAIDLNGHRQHALHEPSSVWSNTNCYVDIWLELLPLLGLNPSPSLVFAFGTDFVGDQWEFVKVSPTDVRELYGIRVGEYDTWRPLLEHIQLQLSLGNICLVEVDAYFLPDTLGTTYGISHVKTTIAPLVVDPAAKIARYLHNDGLFTLAGADFDGIFGKAAHHGLVPSPYVDLVRCGSIKHLSDNEMSEAATRLLVGYLKAAPQGNPVAALNNHILANTVELANNGMAFFHSFTFATTRQLGISAMFAAEFCRWLATVQPNTATAAQLATAVNHPLVRAAAAFGVVCSGSKSLQFKLARVANGRTSDLGPLMSSIESQWAQGMKAMDEHVGALRG